jgi:hypothetical protein
MREMMKPAKERLEWIMRVDRNTMLLDQCHPISSFLPKKEVPPHVMVAPFTVTRRRHEPNRR